MEREGPFVPVLGHFSCCFWVGYPWRRGLGVLLVYPSGEENKEKVGKGEKVRAGERWGWKREEG